MTRSDDDRWPETDRLFERALERRPEQWAAFLDEACGDDTDLRARVESLLEASRESADYFDASGELLARVWLGAEGAASLGGLEGTRLGPYLLEGRIARGGMGSIYSARRDDGRFRQRVAVKVLRRGLDTEDVVRRFEAERRILAGLDHPNIARLLDAGETPDGRPYLVMELVEGERITAWCDARRLGTDERLALFVGVAEAVQHAHRHLVIHRDLKAANILVTAGGEPKLLDFGIAKLLDPAADPDASTRTRTGLRLLTPRSASPEQVDGAPVTTGSDVYQLGLLLYEMLSGAVPYEGLAGRDLEKAIAEDDPPPPSRAVAGDAALDRGSDRARLSRELSGELDGIVERALRKRPDERYATVEQLVADVERYRAGLPVLAAAAGWPYRARKFVRRNRSRVIAAGTLLALLATYAVTVTIQSRRIGAERDRSALEAARAQRTADFLIGLFQSSEPNRTQGDSVTARELLDGAVERLHGELEQDPLVRAALLGTIGRVYTELGLYASARPVLEESVELLRAEPASDPALRSQSLRWLATVTTGGDPARAAALFEEALSAAEAAEGPDGPLVAAVLVDIGETPSGERGAEAVERALGILRSTEDPDPALLARALSASRFAVDRTTAVARMEEAIELVRSAHGSSHTFLAAIMNDLALVLESDDPTRADSLLRGALEINERIYGPDHARTLTMMSNLAGVRRDRGQYAEAAPLYREVLARRARAYPLAENPAERLHRMFPQHGLATSLTEIGAAEEAEPLLREVVHVADSAFDAGHAAWAFARYASRGTLGRNLAVQRRFTEAEPLLLESWEWLRQNRPDDRVTGRIALERVIALYETLGRTDLAAEYRLQLARLLGAGVLPAEEPRARTP